MKCLEDRVDDVLRPSQHIAVPEPQDPEAMAPQACVSMQVLRSPIEVLAAIQFDDHSGFKANEVADIDVDRMLPPERVAVQLPTAQPTPKALFSGSLILAELAGEVDHAAR